MTLHPRRARALARRVSSRRSRHTAAGCALRLESLERRDLLAVLWVDNTPGMAGTEFTSSGGTQPASVAGLVPGVTIFPTISAAIAAAVSGADTINIANGTYAENVVVNKQLIIQGNQFGVDARGRVFGAPSAATESIVAPAGGIAIELQDPADNTTLDGLAVVASVNGATGAIASTTGPTDNLDLINNYVAVASGFTAADLFLNRSAIDADISRNEFVSPAGAAQAIFFDGPDLFHGMHVTSNNVLRSGAAGGTGLFIDGNHNWSISASMRTPLLSGNLIQGFNTGANLGSRSFGSQLTPNAGEISLNDFINNAFDGLQGGPQNTLITRNNFSSNGRSGLALTSFGNMGADRGAQNSQITENFFFANAIEDIFLSATQPAGSIATNTIFNNSLLSARSVTYNGTEAIQASGNWWGAATNPEFTGTKIGGTGAANVDYTPWLDSGIDTAPGTPGFQGSFAVLNVDDDSPQVGVVLRIQEAINLVDAGGIVNVLAGTYEELVNVNKTVELRGAQFGVDARTGRAGPATEAIVRGALSAGFRTTSFVVSADNVVIDGFQIQDTTFANQFGAAIWIQGASEGTAVRNNIVQDNLVGLFLANNNLANPAEVDHNLFRNNTQPGPASGHSIYADQSTAGGAVLGAVIDSNLFTNTAFNLNTWAMGMSNTAAAPFQQIAFSNNEVINHGRGIYLYNTDNSSVSFNTFNGTGVANNNLNLRYAVGLFDGDDNIAIENNRMQNGLRGVWLGADFGNANTNVTINHNALVSNIFANIELDAGSYTGTLDASANHWGTVDPAVVQASITNNSAAAVDFTPLLANNESVPNQALVGFTPDFSALTVHTLGGQAGGIGIDRIQEGIDEAAGGGEVTILAGFYVGDVDASAKAVTLLLGAGTTTAIVQVNGNVTLSADDTIRFELNGLAPGTQHDQLAVTGTVVTGGATAAIDRNFIVPIGQQLVLIDGLSPIVPQFAGLPPNTVVVVDGQAFLIRYNDNDGFDFTLTASNLPPVQVIGTTLVVGGTNGNDKIYVYQSGQKIYVKINGKVFGPFPAASIQSVLVYGLDGNDLIEALSTLKKPVEFHGDAGNDTVLGSKQGDRLDGGTGNDTIKGNNGDDRLYGGDGNDKLYGGNGCDVLVGGAGGDSLFGDAGNDILIGSSGPDKLKGGSGDDIVIGGSTAYDDGATNAASDAALQAISAEWCKKTPYDTRIANIMSGGLAGGAKLDPAPVVGTVFPADGVRDELRGESGRDWFFVVTGPADFDDLDSDRVAKGPNIERKDP